MAIELKQQLKLSQQLVMTPQLQQAIKLLQLSRLELVNLVQKELEENPVLEEAAEVLSDDQSSELEKVIAGVLERIGLDEVADSRMRTFSTGMRKRLALGQLLVRPIQVALLDEPYSGLDSQGMHLVDQVVSEFKAAGTTVLLASHQDGEAVREAEKTGILRRGHLEILPESEPLSRHLSVGGPAGAPEVE